MNPQGVAALMAAVRSSAPPPNPGTPDNRQDPRVEYLQALASARKSLERLVDNTDDPVLKSAFGAMHYAANKAMAGIDPPTILQTLLQSLQAASPPGGPGQPGVVQPPPGLPPTAQAAPPAPNPAMLSALAGGGAPGGPPGGQPPVQSALGAS